MSTQWVQVDTDKTSLKADREDWVGSPLKTLQNTGKKNASGTTPTGGAAASREPTKPPKAFEYGDDAVPAPGDDEAMPTPDAGDDAVPAPGDDEEVPAPGAGDAVPAPDWISQGQIVVGVSRDGSNYEEVACAPTDE